MTEPLQCPAYRRGRAWVAHVSEHGVYGAGPTLRAVGDSIAAGLAHVDVTVPVTVIATTPELEALRCAADAYTTALRAAVTALAQQATTLGDIAQATAAPTKQITALLASVSSQAE